MRVGVSVNRIFIYLFFEGEKRNKKDTKTKKLAKNKIEKINFENTQKKEREKTNLEKGQA